MYLISVYFDDNANKIIKKYMERIAAITGNTYMVDNHVPPHMTISSVEARSGEALIPHVTALENFIKCGEIHFVSVGMFLPYVIYLTPVLNEYLMDMSERVYRAVCELPDVSISKMYQPMRWLPHITLGKKLDKEQMQKAFKVMQESFQPFTAEIVKMGLSSTNPHKDIVAFRMKQVSG